jgi:hypothetical protein
MYLIAWENGNSKWCNFFDSQSNIDSLFPFTNFFFFNFIFFGNFQIFYNSFN